MPIELSLCMIVKNEEENLERCLSGVKDIFDEIIIVDTGSTDRTLEVAACYTDKIYYFEWIDDFAAARNFSFSKATKEYIMWLDADDYITEENCEKISILKEILPPETDFVVMDYYVNVDAEGNAIYKTQRERIVRRAAGFMWTGAIHETIGVSGKGECTHAFVTHGRLNYETSIKRNMAVIQERIDSGQANERDSYYYAYMLFSAGDRENAVEPMEKYLNRDSGYIVGGQDMYFIAYHYYMQKGDPEKALRALTEHEAELTKKSEYYCHLGFFYRDARNDDDKACEYFVRALECKEWGNMAHFSVGSTHEYYYFIPYAAMGRSQIKQKKYREAYDSFRMALYYQPENEEIKALSDKLEQALYAESVCCNRSQPTLIPEIHPIKRGLTCIDNRHGLP